jgi:predicted enzyme related to lactoylglutathione lyase
MVRAYHRKVQVVRITLAVDDIVRMVTFYNESFKCDLSPVSGSSLFRGSFAGTNSSCVQTALAGVVADQNCHQLRLAVRDPEGVAATVVSLGGAVINRSEPDDRLVIGIADPEGNSMELVAQ